MVRRQTFVRLVDTFRSDLCPLQRFLRHNLALQLGVRRQIVTHILHYDDYTTDFDGTVKRLMDFLELGPSFKEKDGTSLQPKLFPPLDFISGKTYDSYFSKKTRGIAKEVVQGLATPECWVLLSRYFPEAL
jgi:hypothetical protein